MSWIYHHNAVAIGELIARLRKAKETQKAWQELQELVIQEDLLSLKIDQAVLEQVTEATAIIRSEGSYSDLMSATDTIREMSDDAGLAVGHGSVVDKAVQRAAQRALVAIMASSAEELAYLRLMGAVDLRLIGLLGNGKALLLWPATAMRLI